MIIERPRTWGQCANLNVECCRFVTRPYCAPLYVHVYRQASLVPGPSTPQDFLLLVYCEWSETGGVEGLVTRLVQVMMQYSLLHCSYERYAGKTKTSVTTITQQIATMARCHWFIIIILFLLRCTLRPLMFGITNSASKKIIHQWYIRVGMSCVRMRMT